MTFIEPLELETWAINVFSGTPEIFTAIAILVLAGGAAFFRMTALGMFFLIGLFFLMFSGYVGQSVYVLISIIGGLMIGYWISKIVK